MLILPCPTLVIEKCRDMNSSDILNKIRISKNETINFPEIMNLMKQASEDNIRYALSHNDSIKKVDVVIDHDRLSKDDLLLLEKFLLLLHGMCKKKYSINIVVGSFNYSLQYDIKHPRSAVLRTEELTYNDVYGTSKKIEKALIQSIDSISSSLSEATGHSWERTINFSAKNPKSKLSAILPFFDYKTQKKQKFDTLRVASYSVSNKNAKKIATYITNNGKSIKKFSVYNNNIQDQGAIELAKALQEVENVEEVNFSINAIKDKGAQQIAELICNSDSIKNVDLMCNGITNGGAIALAEAIEHNKSLSTLMISMNKIKNTGIKAIIDALEYNDTVHDIGILPQKGIGYIESSTAEKLIEILKKNHRITNIGGLDCNDKKQLDTIKSLIDVNGIIKITKCRCNIQDSLISIKKSNINSVKEKLAVKYSALEIPSDDWLHSESFMIDIYAEILLSKFNNDKMKISEIEQNKLDQLVVECISDQNIVETSIERAIVHKIIRDRKIERKKNSLSQNNLGDTIEDIEMTEFKSSQQSSPQEENQQSDDVPCPSSSGIKNMQQTPTKSASSHNLLANEEKEESQEDLSINQNITVQKQDSIERAATSSKKVFTKRSKLLCCYSR